MRYIADYELEKREGDIGYDVRATYFEKEGTRMEGVTTCILKPYESVIIGTSVHVELPKGYYMDARPRSGLAFREQVAMMGLIDTNYRGEIKIKLINLGEKTRYIDIGDRVAQLVLHMEVPLAMEWATEIEQETNRGKNGFGSTGR